MREIENWKGQGENNTKRRPAMYFGANKEGVKEALQFERHRNIPIFKNGSDMSLKLISFQKKGISSKYMCV